MLWEVFGTTLPLVLRGAAEIDQGPPRCRQMTTDEEGGRSDDGVDDQRD